MNHLVSVMFLIPVFLAKCGLCTKDFLTGFQACFYLNSAKSTVLTLQSKQCIQLKRKSFISY